MEKPGKAWAADSQERELEAQAGNPHLQQHGTLESEVGMGQKASDTHGMGWFSA